MNKYLSILCFLTLMSLSSSGQTVQNIMNGIPVRKDNKIFLQYSDGKLKYFVGKGEKDLPQNFLTLPDSAYFLIWDQGVNVYMRPVNPLSFSTSSETKFTVDLLSQQADVALGSIIALMESVAAPSITKSDTTLKSVLGRFEKMVWSEGKTSDCTQAEGISDSLATIRKRLEFNTLEAVKTVFSQLKQMPFEEADSTKAQLIRAEERIRRIDRHFQQLSKSISNLDEMVKKVDCPNDVFKEMVVKNLMDIVLKDLRNALAIQQKRLVLLRQVKSLADEAYKTGVKDQDGIKKWYVHLGEIDAKPGKISDMTVVVLESGFKLSEEGDIQPIEKKETIKRTLRIRKFERFVPEVSAGVAYTFLSYRKYGTETGDDGVMRVADAGEEQFKRLNFSVMLNYNLHLSNSPVHPFLQVGIGASSDYPTLFTGTGIRLSSAPARNIAIAFGLASTWIRELNQLNIGDPVSGTAELEKDISHEFSWPPKPYLGLQYNF